MSTFTGHAQTNDSFTGTAGVDTFLFAAGDIDKLDRLRGNAGTDIFKFSSKGVLAADALTGVGGVERFVMFSAGNGIVLTPTNFAGLAGGRIFVTGSNGNDGVNTQSTVSQHRIDVSAGGGLDVLRGGAGADVFRIAAANLDQDTILGNGGVDQLVLTGAGTISASALGSVAGIEKFNLFSGGNSIVLGNANFAGVGGGRITIIGGAGADSVDASGVTGANAIDVTAGAGADVFKGGAGRDLFRFGAANLAGDTVLGGGGGDELVFQNAGAVAAGGFSGMAGVEKVRLAIGGNSIALSDANFAGVSGAKIVVIGNAGADSVDGSGLSAANGIDVLAGLGLDTLKGGAGRDVFRFTAAGLAGDTVIGGGGSDQLLISTAGTLAAGALAHVSGIEKINLAAGGNALALTDANYSGIGTISVVGSAGNDMVDGVALGAGHNLDFTAGAGNDTLKGGAGDDTFRFSATDLAGDSVQGGSGYDIVILSSAGGLAANALENANGIDEVDLAAGGNAITLTDANYTTALDAGPIAVFGSAGSSSVNASGLSESNRISFFDGGGVDTVSGGAGDDQFLYLGGNAASLGDIIDGGTGSDLISFDQSMNFLGSTITNVEFLYNVGGKSADVSISGANAAGLVSVGSTNLDNATTVFTVQLAADSSTDLSHLGLLNGDAGDAIDVVSTGGSTAVTLSGSIASFTGSDDGDTVGFGSGGHYKDGAAINGAGGDDRITADPGSSAALDGGTGNDTLVLLAAENANLNAEDQLTGDPDSAVNFENVDASAVTSGSVFLQGRDDLVSVLIGGAGADTITAGAAGATITGGLGADTLQGSNNSDRFEYKSTAEATGDSISGGGGPGDGIDVFGDTDFTGTTITGDLAVYISAKDSNGNFTSDSVTVTLAGSQTSAIFGFVGNGFNTDSVETVVIQMDATSLDLSNIPVVGFSGGDHIDISGTSGDDAIVGSSANDVIHGSDGFDSISGGDGDDRIGYVVNRGLGSDGGQGNDTLVVENIPASEATTLVQIDLTAGQFTEFQGENLIYTGNAANFENVDGSQNVVGTDITGNNGDNILIGGSGVDAMAAGLGADTLTGNGGADSFVWKSELDGGDTVTDYLAGTDKLVFIAATFGFNDASFDTVVIEDHLAVQDFSNADLILTFTDVVDEPGAQQFLSELEGTPDSPVFLIARDAELHNLLFYSENAGNNGAVHLIADLGVANNPDEFSPGDFVFI